VDPEGSLASRVADLTSFVLAPVSRATVESWKRNTGLPEPRT
jgi:hypothetical protein